MSVRQARANQDMFLDVDSGDIQQHDRPLYLQLVRYPQEIIIIFDMALGERYEHLFGESPKTPMQV